MENEENLDLELETQNEEDTDSAEESEDVDELAHAQAEAAKYRRLYEKSQKKPVQQPNQAPQQPQTSPTDVEEVVLRANGMSDELLEQLKKVAQVQGTSLIKTQNDPIFVAVKEKFEKDKREKEASLPVSRGSGQQKPKKDFKTPGLSEAERKAMFEARFNS